MGELWGVFCGDLGENWMRYNGTAVYFLYVLRQTKDFHNRVGAFNTYLLSSLSAIMQNGFLLAGSIARSQSKAFFRQWPSLAAILQTNWLGKQTGITLICSRLHASFYACRNMYSILNITLTILILPTIDWKWISASHHSQYPFYLDRSCNPRNCLWL